MNDDQLIGEIKGFIDTYRIQIGKHKILFEDYLKERINKKKDHLVITDTDLLEYNPDLHEELLENGENLIKTFNTIILDEYAKKNIPFTIRIAAHSTKKTINPTHIPIRDIRDKDDNQFRTIKGVIKGKTLTYTNYIADHYYCPTCKRKIISRPSPKTGIIKKYADCPNCKYPLDKPKPEKYSGLSLIVEESPEDLKFQKDTVLRTIPVELTHDLTEKKLDKMLYQGARISCSGIIRYIPLPKKVHLRVPSLECSHFKVEGIEEEYIISPEEEEVIKEIANRDDVLEYLAEEIFQNVAGMHEVKKGLTIAMFGANSVETEITKTRGNIHVLLIGDAGTGKSVVLKTAQAHLPNAKYISGKGSSTAGLTATVEKDETLGRFTIRAGTLPLCHNGFCFIDEFDKMPEDVHASLHEAMEGGSISISKAGIEATLPSQVTIIAAANPKNSNFQEYESYYSEFNLTESLLDRFDLIYAIRDKPGNTPIDNVISRKIFDKYLIHPKDTININPLLIKKYLIYSSKIDPILTEEIYEEYKKTFESIRNMSKKNKSVKAITSRYGEALLRVARAYARIKLHSEVTHEHFTKAVEIMTEYLKNVGYDQQSNELQTTYITLDTQAKVAQIARELTWDDFRNLLEDKETLPNEFTYEDITTLCKTKNLYPTKIPKMLEAALKQGYLFEPRNGLYNRV